jgi:hypothetical protein
VDRKAVLDREIDALDADLADSWEKKDRLKAEIQDAEHKISIASNPDSKDRLNTELRRLVFEFRDVEVNIERISRDRNASIIERRSEEDWLERRKLAMEKKIKR